MMPKGLGFVNRKGGPEDMNLDQYRMGDKYLDALSQGIEIAEKVENLTLSSNRVRFVDKLLQKSPSNLKQLNISNNQTLAK